MDCASVRHYAWQCAAGPVDAQIRCIAVVRGLCAGASGLLFVSAQQSDTEFDATLNEAIESIYQASIT